MLGKHLSNVCTKVPSDENVCHIRCGSSDPVFESAHMWPLVLLL